MKSREYSPKETAVFEAVLKLAGQGVNLAAVKVQQIADAAGVGKGTLYEYFKSKEEILHGTVSWCIWRELDTIGRIADKAPDFISLLNATADYLLQLVTQRAAAYKMLAGMLHAVGSSRLCGSEEELGEAVRYRIGRAYQLARRTGAVADSVEPEYFGFCLSTAIMGYASTLFRANERGVLTDQMEAKQRRHYLRMMEQSLR